MAFAIELSQTAITTVRATSVQALCSLLIPCYQNDSPNHGHGTFVGVKVCVTHRLTDYDYHNQIRHFFFDIIILFERCVCY